MPIQMRIVRRSEEKAMVYDLRHRVFVAEEDRFPLATDHIVDRYDSFEESTNFLALDQGRAVASIRLTMDGPVGLPSAEHFDFSACRRRLTGGCAAIGWLCALKSHRGFPGLVATLIKMCFREMRRRGARHVLSVLHPPVMPMLEKLVGARAVGPVFQAGGLKVPMLPIHVDLERLPAGGREVFEDPEAPLLEDSNERRIYRRGEVIVRKGDVGTEVFRIMRGAVRASGTGPLREGGGDGPIFSAGQMFGELSLLDGGPRTTTVVAHAGEVDLMVWSREELMAQLQAQPHKTLEILTLLGGRMRPLVEGRPTGTPAETVARILVGASRQGRLPVSRDWLGRQCDISGETFDTLIHDWENRHWIAADRDAGALRVIDHGCLAGQCAAP
jgi:CRP-like cAMP-binding protein